VREGGLGMEEREWRGEGERGEGVGERGKGGEGGKRRNEIGPDQVREEIGAHGTYSTSELFSSGACLRT